MSIEILAGIVGLFFMFALFFSGVEIGIAMAVTGFLGFTYLVSFSAATNLVAKDFFDVFSTYSLTVIPLFVLMGQIASNSGIGANMYKSAHKFMGHVPGGLGMATVAGCTLFGAICGSTTATAATFASVSVQEMRAYKYRDDLIGGVIASSGGIGILIPPSVIFIVYGIFTQQSIGTLFLSGILPGLLVAFLFVLTIYIWCKKNPAVGPKSERAPWKARLATLPAIIDIIIIFVIVMGGMLGGFFTPTEGGAVGAFAVLVVALITRKAGIKDIYRSVLEGLVSSCMVLVIVAGATVFGHFLAVTNIPTEIATWVGQLPLPREMVLAMILLVYLIGGCVIDALALIILTVPIFYPVILALKFDPIWFGSIIVLITMMGVITPPVGVNSYVVSGISKIELQTVFKGVWPFLIALVIATILLIAFPQIALFIPTLLGK